MNPRQGIVCNYLFAVAVLCMFLAKCDHVESTYELNNFRSNVFEPLKRESRSVGSVLSSNVTVDPNNATLESVLANIVSNTNIFLEPGSYKVENFSLVSGVNNIAIIGQDNVTITCEQNVGLAFVNVSELVIRNVRIDGCGLSGVNLDQSLDHLRQIVNLFYVVYSEMRFALFIGHCENVRIESVEVVNNIGFGLVGINVIGSSLIRQLNATNNTQPSTCFLDPSAFTSQLLSDPSRYGGGAVFLYQDYLPSHQQEYNNRHHSLDIEQGLFTNNSECSFGYLSDLRFGDPTYIFNLGQRIGGGGGLALLLSQLNYSVSIVTSDSHFEDNIATLGASAHLTIFSGVKDSSVLYKNCTFRGNGVDSPGNLQTSTSLLAAGGLGIVIDLFRSDSQQALAPHVVHNLNTSIRVVNSKFTDNTASFGAALYFYSGYRSAVSDLTDVINVFIENCYFARNKAFIGSALQLYEYKLSAGNFGTQIHVSDTTFFDNSIVTTDPNLSQSLLQSAGVVDIRNLNVTLSGKCVFESNNGTALRAEMSYVGIDGNITFNGNIGVYGGALHLVSYTYLIVLPNSSLYFLNNVARVSGGAIYSNFIGMNSYVIGGNSDCFLFFDYATLGFCVNCSDLNRTGVYLKFENNRAPSGSHIFGSSLLTCPWTVAIRREYGFRQSILEIVADIFPTIFDFDQPPVGPVFVKTQSSILAVVNANESSAYDPDNMVYNVLPGEVFNVTLIAVDDFLQVISNIVSAFILSDIPLFVDANRSAIALIGTSNLGLLQNDIPTSLPVKIFGTEGQNLSVILFSTDSGGRAQTQIRVNVGYCGVGFIFNTSTQRCECDPALEQLGVDCDINNQLLLTRSELWVGPVDDTGVLGVRSCLLLYCQFGTNQIPFINGEPDFDSQCNPRLNRGGVLCGQCREGYSMVLGSARCVKCTNVYILLFPLFILVGLLLMFIVYFLDITVTGGLINGAIFFSNLVTLYSDFLFPASVGSSFFFLFSFLTLNLGIETCLYDGLGPLDRLWWQLSFPLYLFLLMGTIALIARTRYFEISQITNRSSVIRAFVTLMVLCYVSVLQATVELIGFIQIPTVTGQRELRWISNPSQAYFRGGHGALAFMSILLALLYIIPFPIFLLFPSLLYRSRYLSQYKPIYDAFWQPFEPKFRFWLGFRLIFRWLPFGLSFIGPTPVGVFVTDLTLVLLLFIQLSCKPFKNHWKNIVDSVFILILIAMFTGSLYFTAESYFDSTNSERRGHFNVVGTSYNLVLVSISFLIITAIVCYHIIVRFPKLKVIIRRSWAKVRGKGIQKGEEGGKTVVGKELKRQEQNVTSQFTHMSQADKTTPQPLLVTLTELREPLLEDCGEVTVVSLPSTLIKTGSLHDETGS